MTSSIGPTGPDFPIQDNVEFDAHGQNPETGEARYQQDEMGLPGISESKPLHDLPEPASGATDTSPQGIAGSYLDQPINDHPAFNNRGHASVRWVEEFHDPAAGGAAPQQSASHAFLDSEMKYSAAVQIAGHEEAGSQQQENYEHLRKNVDFDGRGNTPGTEEASFQQGGAALIGIIRDKLIRGLPGSTPGAAEVRPQENIASVPDDSPSENLGFNSRGNARVRQDEPFHVFEGTDSDDDDE